MDWLITLKNFFQKWSNSIGDHRFIFHFSFLFQGLTGKPGVQGRQGVIGQPVSKKISKILQIKWFKNLYI